MKKIWIQALFTIVMNSIQNYVLAQNFVPNPSFEDTISCYPRIDSVSGWHNPTAYSPDYFNSFMLPFAPYNDYSVPLNCYGSQTPRTGSAYAGVIAALMLGSNAREYIQSELTDSLTGGRRYCVIFYVCLTDSSPFAVNNFGAYFSNNPISSPQITNLNYSPQINNNVVLNPLTQRNTWVKIEDTFIANGGEKYITIGNFKNDLNTDTVDVLGGSSSLQYSYYYIDDVSVYDCSLNNITEQNINDYFQVYYNDINDQLEITSLWENISQIKIFDLKGAIVLQEEPNSFQVKEYLNNFHGAIFFLLIQTKNRLVVKKILTTKK